MYFFKTITVNPVLPERIGRLKELSYNLWFSWHPEALELFKQIDEQKWKECNHNPVKLLLEATGADLERVAGNQDYLQLYDKVMADLDRYMTEGSWFLSKYPHLSNKSIAYFSAEFGLHESLPIYSGGLGVLAGDHCKAASDIGLPLVGIGLLYKQGYFTQHINREGWQEALYPYQNYHEMPVKPAKSLDGREIIIPVNLPGRQIYLKVWEVQVGRIKIYLLDADITLNSDQDRKLTAQLYGGDKDTRISQEILLGVGGVKALRIMGINPGAWHINEGHAAFLCIERLQELVQTGVPLAAAKEVVRASTLFTTHTPVSAGHDVFDADKVDYYLNRYYSLLGLDRDGFMELGWDPGRQIFNMTILAMNLSAYCNGVSKLHGEVTRKMFHYLYEHIPVEEVPVFSVTNGIHTLTWMSEELKTLLDAYLPSGWQNNISDREQWEAVENIPDEELWTLHRRLKKKCIHLVRGILKEQKERHQESVEMLGEVEQHLNPDAFTIGFARRFATYKRAALLLRDKERLARLLTDPERPVQIIFSGKAHPADHPGQELIKQIHDLSQQEPFKGKIVFIENYDMNVSRHLTQGVDLWLNTPRWPMEASGTSGMKAAANGVVNCSVLDGWWPEGYDEENGYAIGEETGYRNEEEQDRDDAYRLYSLLEEKIIPTYYHQTEGCPKEWVARMKKSIKTITPLFSTERMVKEYAERFYTESSIRGQKFTAENFKIASQVHNYKRFIKENWHYVTVKGVEAPGDSEMRVGDTLQLAVKVYLGPIPPEDVKVEAVHGCEGDHSLTSIKTVPLEVEEQFSEGLYKYKGAFALEQGTCGFTVRIRPEHPYFATKFELPLASWAQSF
ncbi:alpha-glucan family phosphorylase [Desulforamulus ruminis]|uniref:Alpha-glucan phosphorylase n=1 Tax=Desulforamulus ruminis (strain ATCC 23193 / DSM 2154 / NCIMB 8452 / DL) TaxID=696281 RepID=F6DQI3_DESRL|nr:alpha-glucan family phosphorylase [Desulforamulus ruminis]AEG60877.1 alpha-glucan phosphorylase [Desulforamulus ruminis DSM 2154]